MMNTSQALDRGLVNLARHRAERDGIGEAAQYMRIHEPQHPAEITSHLVKIAAAKRKVEQ